MKKKMRHPNEKIYKYAYVTITYFLLIVWWIIWPQRGETVNKLNSILELIVTLTDRVYYKLLGLKQSKYPEMRPNWTIWGFLFVWWRAVFLKNFSNLLPSTKRSYFSYLCQKGHMASLTCTYGCVLKHIIASSITQSLFTNICYIFQ